MEETHCGSTISSQKTCIQSRPSSFEFEIELDFVDTSSKPDISCHMESLSMKASSRLWSEGNGAVGQGSVRDPFDLFRGDSSKGRGPGRDNFRKYNRIWIWNLITFSYLRERF